jgi:predicted lipid carrier protein YhbT
VSAQSPPAPPASLFQGALRSIISHLPIAPPSFLLARVLDQLLLPRLPTDARQALLHQTVELQVTDLGVRVRLQLGANGFQVAPTAGEAALRILAPASSYLRLLRGEDDADRLFFERVLVMEGDTELGLVLKNTLDAIGPLLHLPGGKR